MKGIYNEGNTCYFASTLQCLMQTPCLTNYLLKNKYVGPCKITMEYSNLVSLNWLGKKDTPLKINKLLELICERFPQFRGYNQQDSHEILTCLFEAFDKSIPRVREMFYSTITQHVVSSKEDNRTLQRNLVIFLEPNTDTDLETLLDTFCDIRTVSGTKSTTCIQDQFWYLPQTLIFCFKLYHRKHRINVPEKLDMTKWTRSKKCAAKYILYATSTHHGGTRGGHYTAYTKHKNKWYLKNDTSVQETEYQPLAGHYMAFFKREKNNEIIQV